MATATHSTIETTGSGAARVRRFECACGFVLELHGNVPREIARGGDSGVEHTGSGWQLTYR